MAKKVKKKFAAKKGGRIKKREKDPHGDSSDAPLITAPVIAPNSPRSFRVRVRMYRQGLGDCFLITFTRKGRTPFQMLIDCGRWVATRSS